MKVTCRDAGWGASEVVCRAFSKGCGARIEPVTEPARGDEVTFLYGILRGGMTVYLDRVQLGLPFLFCDNGYLRPGQFDGYYRVTWNRRQHTGRGMPDYARFDRLGIEILPWRRSGGKIIVCPPPPIYEKSYFFDGEWWLKYVHKLIRRKTNREIVLRWRTGDPRRLKDQPGLAEDFSDAWALVTHESNVAVEALIAGVPVFLTGHCSTRAMGWGDLSCIESPIYPENRREWLAVLAANQWTLEEMADGTCWRALTEKDYG